MGAEGNQIAQEVDKAWEAHNEEVLFDETGALYLSEEQALSDGLHEYRVFKGSTPKHLRDTVRVQLGPNGLKPIPEGEW